MEWREDAAAAWEAEDVEIGVTREATELAGQGLPVSSLCFQQWMQRAESEATAGDTGYPIGKRVFAMLMDDSGASEGDVDLWNLARRMVAEVFDTKCISHGNLFATRHLACGVECSWRR